MSKKIAVINDLSGFGKCSLTAAIPVISVMGVQACPMPTAILSAQTEYPSYFIDDFEDRMDFFRSEWKKMGVTFDGIYTGFVSSEAQIDHIFDFLDSFYQEDTFLLVDPVMGDNGEPYEVFTGKLLEKMKQLSLQADILTPNVTELCLLTGEDYEELLQLDDDSLMERLRLLAYDLMAEKEKSVLITGIDYCDSNGTKKIGNLLVNKNESFLTGFDKIGGSFSGTGDLFASVLAGGIARGDSVKWLCELAGEFVQKSMMDATMAGISRNDGSEFEQHLGMLIAKEK